MHTKLRRIRCDRGISQERLAELIEVTRASVIGWEHGRHRPHPRQRRQLTAMFGYDINYLLAPENDDGLPEEAAA